jgi:hypothetical protein
MEYCGVERSLLLTKNEHGEHFLNEKWCIATAVIEQQHQYVLRTRQRLRRDVCRLDEQTEHPREHVRRYRSERGLQQGVVGPRFFNDRTHFGITKSP